MAASQTPRPTAAADNPARAPLAALALAGPVALAYSGGADSTALLHAACQRWPGQLSAIHIHHGLQAAADDFAAHCESTCRALGVPLVVVAVHARHAPGESPEDAARQARYAALAEAARQQGAHAVLLAQHADDQVETLLIALSRGAGLPGLAAMPARFERHGMAFVRPLLDVPGPALRDWLTQQGLAFVDDPTNADASFTRNRIRQQVLPALQQALPQFRATFARSARHAAQAQRLLAEVAAQDLAHMGGEPAIAALRALSTHRCANVLRHWLRQVYGVSASAAQLDELQAQLQACTTRGHGIQLRVAKGQVQRAGDRLTYHPPL